MKRICYLLWLALAYFPVNAQNNYPTPPDAVPRLFYIQRTGSPNTVVYDANIGSDGQFKKDNPISVYWLRYSENGQRQDLNYLQRTLAYGVKWSAAGNMNEYIFHLVSYAQRKFRLKKDGYGRPVVSMTLNGKEAYLKRVFIELEPTLFGLRPNIHYVEIYGVDAQTGRMAYEKFIP
jgi:hypothetical protein